MTQDNSYYSHRLTIHVPLARSFISGLGFIYPDTKQNPIFFVGKSDDGCIVYPPCGLRNTKGLGDGVLDLDLSNAWYGNCLLVVSFSKFSTVDSITFFIITWMAGLRRIALGALGEEILETSHQIIGAPRRFARDSILRTTRPHQLLPTPLSIGVWTATSFLSETIILLILRHLIPSSHETIPSHKRQWQLL
jgi:hypothetical protein